MKLSVRYHTLLNELKEAREADKAYEIEMMLQTLALVVRLVAHTNSKGGHAVDASRNDDGGEADTSRLDHACRVNGLGVSTEGHRVDTM